MAVNPSELSRLGSGDLYDGDITVTEVTAADDQGGAVQPADHNPARPTRRRRVSARQKFEARKVRRLIRHIDPWSVLKLSLVFYFCMWLVGLISSVIVWQVATSSGTIGKFETFLSNLGIADPKINGEFFLRQFGLVGLIVVLSAALVTTVAAVIFNLISDLIGGVWITVIEEETARPVTGSPAHRGDV